MIKNSTKLNKTQHILALLVCSGVVLACTLTSPQEGSAVLDIQQTLEPVVSNSKTIAPVASSTPSPGATLTPAPEATQVLSCEVHTGAPAGWLNVRACGSTRCEVLAVVSEGEQLVLLEQPGEAWLKVQTGELVGYVYSNFCVEVIR
jgi:hypothetical protein